MSSGDEYLEAHGEAESLISEEEPRTLAEILDAEQEFFDRVWYVRSIVRSGQDTPGMPGDIRAGVMQARQQVEDKVRARQFVEANRPGT